VSNIIEVMVLVEGQTELTFIKKLFSPYIANLTGNKIFLTPMQPGKQGGDVRFERYKKDIGIHLKQRNNTYITLMLDYYGIKDWPGLEKSKQQTTPSQKAEIINIETAKEVQKLFSEENRECRFVSYVSMHEIEALYFSDPASIAQIMNIEQAKVESILSKYSGPEAINDSFETAPSKRLENLSQSFVKTTTGIAIAEAVNIPRMREHCPLFDEWVKKIKILEPLS
jgi:hypothetical protein